MGRPLKEITLEGLPVKAWLNSGSRDATILAQKGTGVYEVNFQTYFDRVKLVDKSAPQADGEAVMVITPFGGSAQRVRQLNGRQVKLFDGSVYSWTTGDAAKAGEAGFGLVAPTFTVNPVYNPVGSTIVEDASVTVNAGTKTGPTPITTSYMWETSIDGDIWVVSDNTTNDFTATGEVGSLIRATIIATNAYGSTSVVLGEITVVAA